MFIRNLKDCREFTAGDDTVLRELLHGDKDELDLQYSLAQAVLKPGKTSRLHRLKSSEMYYILEGEGLMHIDDEARKVVPGCAVYIPPHAKQCIKNTGKTDLTFLCIVEPAWKVQDEEVL